MADEKKEPEFYGGTPSGQGQKVPHGAGRQARLEAEGIPQGKSLADAWQEKADAAFAAGSQEDPGQEYQRAEAKAGRQNVMPISPESMAEIQRLARESGKPIHPESGLIHEPVTETTVEGHSAEKKEALKVMKKEGVSIQDAVKMVRGEQPRKKSSRKGK